MRDERAASVAGAGLVGHSVVEVVCLVWVVGEARIVSVRREVQGASL